MIPSTTGFLNTDIKISEQPSLTYRLNTVTNTISGMIDGKEALAQAIYLLLNTDRYAYEIYSWNYGSEVNRLLGEQISYALPEIKRRITEALTCDDRITGIGTFETSITQKGKVMVKFAVQSIFGDIPIETEVNV